MEFKSQHNLNQVAGKKRLQKKLEKFLDQNFKLVLHTENPSN